MIYLYLDTVDVAEYLSEGSLVIVDQIQNRANTANLTLNTGVEALKTPEKLQDVKIYDGVTIVSASGTSIVVNDVLRSGNSLLTYGKFRADQYLWIGIGESTEEKVQIDTIEAGSEGEVNITLKVAIVNSHSAGEKIGKLIFGGTISNPETINADSGLTNVDYQIECIDYMKIFDKRNVNDSWEDRTAQYIVNDFLNTTVNYNKSLDTMEYASNAAAQAVWVQSGVASLVQRRTSDFVQGETSVIFQSSGSSGSMVYTNTTFSLDLSDFVGVSSGAPTEGRLTFWYNRGTLGDINSLTLRVGSSVGNSVYKTFTLEETSDEWILFSAELKNFAVDGTPDWTAVDYFQFSFSVDASSVAIFIDDVRIIDRTGFTSHHVEAGLPLADVRASFKKPTVFMEQMARATANYWFVDYERDIHFFDRETNSALIEFTDTSENFSDLTVSVDITQLKNKQVVRGGTRTSTSDYMQVVEGNNGTREWIMKAQFKNLSVALDDNTSTDSMEVGTTTTNVTATAHGLATGDYVVNRTRSNAVRKITYVDANNFTVEEVTSQTSGDTFSKFATAKTVGVEYLDDEASYNYMSNFQEKSIRASEDETTLREGEFLLFTYNEIIPIRVEVADSASVAALKAIMGGDGVFDGPVITDKSIESLEAANDAAQAELTKYSNPIVTVSVTTDHEGIESGQIVRIQSTSRGVNEDFIVQQVRIAYAYGGDYPVFNIVCASTLFGLIEYLQMLTNAATERDIDEDELIEQIASENVTVTITEAHSIGPDEEASEAVTVTIGESHSTEVRDMTTDPYKWQPDPTDAKWNLAQWG